MADLTAKIGVDTSELSKGLDDATRKISNFGKNLSSLGKGLTVGLTLPIMAVGTAAFKMAADLEDAFGASEQVFKGASDSVKEWAESLPSYYGVAAKEAIEYSNMMGSMLKNIGGLTEEEAGKQSAKLIELAADLAAMYGGTTADAVRALTGALKGNNTMLDNYGMAANDAIVKAKAFEMGLISQGQEMSLATKQAATLAVVYDQVGDAQGQAEREAKGSSGAMRSLTTSVRNLATELGDNLLPVITPIINKITEFTEWFRELSPTVKRVTVVIAGLAAALGPVLVVVGQLISSFSTVIASLGGVKAALAALTGPVGWVVAGLAAIVAVVVTNWDKIKPYVMNTIKYFIDLYNESVVVRAGVAAIATMYKNTFDIVKRVLQGAWEVIKTWAKSTADSFAGVGTVMKSALTLDPSGVKRGLQEIRDAQMYGFASMGNDVSQMIKGIYSDIKENVNEGLDMIRNVDPLTMEDLFPTKPLKIEIPSLVDTKKLEDDAGDLGENVGDKIKEGIQRSLAVSAFTGGQGAGIIVPDVVLEPPIIVEPKFEYVTDFQKELLRLREINAELNEAMTELFSETMSGGVTDLFSSVGNAIGEGGNVIQAMGQSLLQSFGGFLSKLGGMLIKYGLLGTAFGKLQMAIQKGTPAMKISAGIAAIAVGALLTAAGGALSAAASGSISGGAGGGGGYTGYSGYSSPAPNNAGINNYQEQQNVTFRISGNDLVGAINNNQERTSRITAL